MPKSLKRFSIVTLGAISLAFCVLAIASYNRMIEFDESTDGANWKCANVADGAILLVYVGADTPPTSGKFKAAASNFWTRQLALNSLRSAQVANRKSFSLEQIFSSSRKENTLDNNEIRRIKDILRLRFVRESIEACKDNSFAGFFLHTEAPPREVVLRIPLAAFVLLFGLLPTLCFVSWLRTRARCKRESLCLSCGYNLTGNTSGKCPECGTATGADDMRNCFTPRRGAGS